MMSSPSSSIGSNRRRSSSRIDRFAISTAFLLLGSTTNPTCCVHARTLRRGSSSSSSSSLTNDNHDHDVMVNEAEAEESLDAQFEVVGVPNMHEPFLSNDATMTDRSGRRVKDAVEDEEDASLVVFVSETIIL